VQRHPLAQVVDGKITCPAHVCATCAKGDPTDQKASVGKQLLHCLSNHQRILLPGKMYWAMNALPFDFV